MMLSVLHFVMGDFLHEKVVTQRELNIKAGFPLRTLHFVQKKRIISNLHICKLSALYERVLQRILRGWSLRFRETKKECMRKKTGQSYLFILTVLPPLQQLCSPISRSYFKELHNYTILPVTIFIQLLQHTALTCLSHFEDGLPGRMVIVLQDFHRIFLQSNLDFKKLTEAYIR